MNEDLPLSPVELVERVPSNNGAGNFLVHRTYGEPIITSVPHQVARELNGVVVEEEVIDLNRDLCVISAEYHVVLDDGQPQDGVKKKLQLMNVISGDGEMTIATNGKGVTIDRQTFPYQLN